MVIFHSDGDVFEEVLRGTPEKAHLHILHGWMLNSLAFQARDCSEKRPCSP
jgi:hypothetical protein